MKQYYSRKRKRNSRQHTDLVDVRKAQNEKEEALLNPRPALLFSSLPPSFNALFFFSSRLIFMFSTRLSHSLSQRVSALRRHFLFPLNLHLNLDLMDADTPRVCAFSSVGVAASGEAGQNKKRVGTHNGSFHCDEALACFLIRLTSKFAAADVVRTRDPQVFALITPKRSNSIPLMQNPWMLLMELGSRYTVLNVLYIAHSY